LNGGGGLGSQRFGAFVEDVEVGVVGEDSVAAVAGEFAGDSGMEELGHGFAGGGEGDAGELAELGQGEQRALAEGGQDTEGVGGAAAGLLDAVGVMVEEGDESACGIDGSEGGDFHTFEEEIDPCFPIAGGADAVEKVVIDWAVLFEEEAEVEEWLTEQTAVVEEEGDEQAAEAAVAVEEGVDGLELDVSERGFEEDGRAAGVFMKVGFESGHAGFQHVRGWRDETGVAGAGAADPVLGAAEFAGFLVAATAAGHQVGVHFPEQAIAEREAVAQAVVT